MSWNFNQVKAYIDEHNVPRNALLDQGYKSVGDWHSTQKSGEGEAGERAGRWKGKDKTECGLHKDYFKMKMAAKKKVSFGHCRMSRLGTDLQNPQAREDELQLRDEARSRGSPIDSLISEGATVTVA